MIKIAKYGLVGILGQSCDVVITYSLMGRLGLMTAVVIAYVIAAVGTYIAHTLYTFSKNSKTLLSRRKIINFSMALMCGIFTSYIVIKVGSLFDISANKTKILQLLFVAIAQYSYNRYITFRE